jgi:hypothetical protein
MGFKQTYVFAYLESAKEPCFILLSLCSEWPSPACFNPLYIVLLIFLAEYRVIDKQGTAAYKAACEGKEELSCI